MKRIIVATAVLLLAACTSTASGGTTSSPTATREPWIVYQWIPADGRADAVFLAHPDGSASHVLLPVMAGRDLFHPDWSPDGTRIAFAVGRGDRSDLWVADADGANAHRLVTCSLPCNTISLPDWSPDGRRILFGQDDAPFDANGVPTTFEVRAIDVETGKITTLLERHDGMTAEMPRWSPDARHVVFVRYRLDETDTATGSALFVADLNGGPERRLTPWKLFAAYPDWGANGTIVFNTYNLSDFEDTTNAANLYTIAPDGTQLRQVTTFGPSSTRATQPRWTPDGTTIIFTEVIGSGWGTRTMAMISPDGSDLRPATATSLDGTHPELQPTGL